MRRLRDHTLSLTFGRLFLGALVGQAFAGWAASNSDQVASGLGQLRLGGYLTSAGFAVDVAENWQSEYLQFLLYILGMVWLVQRRYTVEESGLAQGAASPPLSSRGHCRS